ncbi:hypothetical protein [Virgibacillus sp. YIM 98842]|uniref:hypothetical protein n=1 Tax=Virgibacillus sp. YIM 98842 TaxID=2663533 RepID=UPI0013DA2FD6|nr:hypothetical protein [Virgibacillus sp. YIM 98842]
MKKALFIMLFSGLLIGCNSQAAEYGEGLQDVADQMLDNAAKAEEILNQYAVVWDHTIQSGGAIPVSEMSTITGLEESVVRGYFEVNNIDNIPDDFSNNIHSLNAYYNDSGDLDHIEKTADEIKNKINELNDPPEEFEKTYDELLDMYTFYTEYVDMAFNPDGSLQSFNEKVNQLSSDIAGKYKRIEAVMPNEN